MTRAISRDELQADLPRVLDAVGKDCFLVEEKPGVAVAAIVSMQEYEFIRQKKAEDAIAAMWELRNHLQSVATPEELADLEKELHERSR
jgi:hypothetical protein